MGTRAYEIKHRKLELRQELEAGADAASGSWRASHKKRCFAHIARIFGRIGQAGGDSERTPIHYGADEAGIVGGSETADRTKHNGMGAAEVAPVLLSRETYCTYYT